ncbi:DUF6538 domain-containing protein [Rhizobium nepotum]|uniref:DUF6538 domain-containing protein n=1 Tax=Rhizobium nepotum TaxID=1035271 RepID=UPI00336A1AC6
MGSNPPLSAIPNLLIYFQNLPFLGNLYPREYPKYDGESMYLTHRKTGFRFQIAVPADLQVRIGRTPIRIPLRNMSASSARRAARLLSGHAERLFIAVRALRGRDIDPPAQTAVNGGFTMSAMSFNILEHLSEKSPEGCEPVDGGFSMFRQRRACVN